jgi:hypothetical protein
MDKIMLFANDDGTLDEWAEPKVTEFDVRDTAEFPGVGRDGGAPYPDCTRS